MFRERVSQPAWACGNRTQPGAAARHPHLTWAAGPPLTSPPTLCPLPLSVLPAVPRRLWVLAGWGGGEAPGGPAPGGAPALPASPLTALGPEPRRTLGRTPGAQALKAPPSVVAGLLSPLQGLLRWTRSLLSRQDLCLSLRRRLFANSLATGPGRGEGLGPGVQADRRVSGPALRPCGPSFPSESHAARLLTSVYMKRHSRSAWAQPGRQTSFPFPSSFCLAHDGF